MSWHRVTAPVLTDYQGSDKSYINPIMTVGLLKVNRTEIRGLSHEEEDRGPLLIDCREARES